MIASNEFSVVIWFYNNIWEYELKAVSAEKAVRGAKRISESVGGRTGS
jgi:hypothetical protein